MPRSPVIGSSKIPLIAPGSNSASKGRLKTEQHKAELVKKPTQLMIEAGGLGPILTGGMNIVTGTGQTLRANRFQAVPNQEVHGKQVRYKLPITL